MLDEEDSAVQPLQGKPEPRQNSRYIKMSKRKLIALMIFGPLVALIIGILIGHGTKSSSSSSDSGSTSPSVTPAGPDKSITDLLFDEMKPENIKEYLGVLTAKVHDGGSDREEKELVDYIVGKWEKQLDKTEVFPYNILLSYPNDTDPNYVAVVDDKKKEYDKSTPFEPPFPGEDFAKIRSTYNAYGQAGDVQGALVYVNFGSTDDFDQVKMLNVDVKGKICIARYGKMFRGDKARNAEKYGCAGLIIFTDPANYGNSSDPGDTFPNSIWMPHTGVQRGSLYMREGDPLTPMYPAWNSTYRIPENESGLPTIPVQPISSDDAYKYLSKLGGPQAPDDWQGGLNITYNVGGVMRKEFENHTLLLHVANYRPIKEVNNIIGIIKGAVEPDRYVIIGNHRDAWVFGSIDPSSGTAVMMEIARAMGKLVKSGQWRPHRSVLFCSWGAEEFGLLGSTEWTEEFEKSLLLKAVTYLNVDIAVQGTTTLRAKATPNLRRILYDVAKVVPNPDQREIDQKRPTVYDTWKLKYPDKSDHNRPQVGPLGSGSDYTFFLQKTGVSSVDMRYTYDEVNLKLSSYPIYHSAHETIEAFEKLYDPHYKYSLAVARVWGELTRRIADAVVIPFDCVEYAEEIQRMVSTIDKNYSEALKEQGIELDGLHRATNHLLTSAKNLNESIAMVNHSLPLELRQLNDKLMYMDRGFLDFAGLPGRSYYRHIVYAPSIHNSYSGAGFPGFVDAIHDAKTDGNWELVKKQLSVTTYHLYSAANSILDPNF